MNAEVYYILESGITRDISTLNEEIVSQFKHIGINVIYKTEVESNSINLSYAFKETRNSNDKVDIVLIIGGLYNQENSFIKKFFMDKGISLNNQNLSKNVDVLTADSIDIPGYAIKSNDFLIICLPWTKRDLNKLLNYSIIPYIIAQKESLNNLQSNGVDINYDNDGQRITTQKQKKSFIKTIFPVKGDSISTVLSKIILLISIIIFIVSGCILINIYIIKPYLNNKKVNDIKSSYYDSSTGDQKDSEGRLEKFSSLTSINSDIKGWVTVPNTPIDYPVLQPPSNDPQFYLYRDYNKKYTGYGSIFIDAICSLNPNSKNIILHGHHMRNGQMFAKLLNYDDITFYNNNPIITFDTIYEEGKWKVISVIKVNTLASQGEPYNYLISDFANDSQFLNYVHQIKSRSVIDTPVDINEDDYLITLSTCSYEFKDFRTAVVARKVRQGESEYVDTSLAKVASNPLMPDIWYKKYGGKKPNIGTFEKDLANGKINWYKPTK